MINYYIIAKKVMAKIQFLTSSDYFTDEFLLYSKTSLLSRNQIFYISSWII